MLKHIQADTQADMFKCVGCGNTVTGRNVEGSGPLDMEQQADDLYNHALGVLQQQVWVIKQTFAASTGFKAALVFLFLLLALLQLVCSPTAIEDLLLHVIWLSAHTLAALGGITTHVIVTLMSVSLVCPGEGVSPVPP